MYGGRSNDPLALFLTTIGLLAFVQPETAANTFARGDGARAG